MVAAADVFIVRKPVLDRDNKVYGYKLLHSNVDPKQRPADGPDDSALALIHDSMLVFDLGALASGKKVFFGFTQETLETDCFELLPPECAVIDLHPSLTPRDETVAACRRLKDAGYTIAAPMGNDPRDNRLVELADIVSVDFRQWPRHEVRRDRIAEMGQRSYLARSVNSQDDLELALDLGCTYVEGRYFNHAARLSGRGVPGFKPSYLKLLRAINQSEPDFRALAAIIAPEVTLTYKLLRLVNSAIYGPRARINSVDRALVMLGERGIRQWAALIAMSELAARAPTELVTASAIRARFCQSLGEALAMDHRNDDLFLLGLFSLLDVIADQPLCTLLDDLGIDGLVKDALMGRSNELRPIYDLVMAYEQGDWDAVVDLVRFLGLDHGVPADLYLQSVEWANFSLDLTV